MLRPAATVPLTCEADAASARFELQSGEHAEFEFGNQEDARIGAVATETCFEETINYWRRWSKKSN